MEERSSPRRVEGRGAAWLAHSLPASLPGPATRAAASHPTSQPAVHAICLTRRQSPPQSRRRPAQRSARSSTWAPRQQPLSGAGRQAAAAAAGQPGQARRRWAAVAATAAPAVGRPQQSGQPDAPHGATALPPGTAAPLLYRPQPPPSLAHARTAGHPTDEALDRAQLPPPTHLLQVLFVHVGAGRPALQVQRPELGRPLQVAVDGAVKVAAGRGRGGGGGGERRAAEGAMSSWQARGRPLQVRADGAVKVAAVGRCTTGWSGGGMQRRGADEGRRARPAERCRRGGRSSRTGVRERRAADRSRRTAQQAAAAGNVAAGGVQARRLTASAG